MSSAPVLSCVFALNRELEGWEKVLHKICHGIEGLTCHYLESTGYIRGEVDPKIFIKKLYKARSYVSVYRIDYGYEKNPEEIRKPNSPHFMRCIFYIIPLDISWYKKIIGALKTVQGVSFTIEVLPITEYMTVYLCGNIEFPVLMKMLKKTGIVLHGWVYGADNKDPNLMPPPPVKVEALANGTQPATNTEPPPPPEVASTSTHLRVEHKESRSFRKVLLLMNHGFRRLCC